MDNTNQISSTFITSGGGAWFSPNGKCYPLDSSHEQFVNENRDLFEVPSDINGDDLVSDALIRGWVRIRGKESSINIEILPGSLCISKLADVASYLVNEAGLDLASLVDLDIYDPSTFKGSSIRCTLQDLVQKSASIPSFLTASDEIETCDQMIPEASTLVSADDDVNSLVIKGLELVIECSEGVSEAFKKFEESKLFLNSKGESNIKEIVNSFHTLIERAENKGKVALWLFKEAIRKQDTGMNGDIIVEEINKRVAVINGITKEIESRFINFNKKIETVKEDIMKSMFIDIDEIIKRLKMII